MTFYEFEVVDCSNADELDMYDGHWCQGQSIYLNLETIMLVSVTESGHVYLVLKGQETNDCRTHVYLSEYYEYESVCKLLNKLSRNGG